MTFKQLRTLPVAAAIVVMTTGAASAQQAAAGSTSAPATPSRAWVVAGGGYVALRGDCETCEGDVYRRAGGVLADIGFRVNPRMDAAAELFWVPSSTHEGVTLRSTHLLGVAQYRPWVRHGFFLKGGMGFAFVKNWVYSTSSSEEAPPYTTTGLGLTYGTGWAFYPTRRVSMQIFGAHYVTTLGNLTTGTETTVENVIGNIWVVGAALVFR